DVCQDNKIIEGSINGIEVPVRGNNQTQILTQPQISPEKEDATECEKNRTIAEVFEENFRFLVVIDGRLAARLRKRGDASGPGAAVPASEPAAAKRRGQRSGNRFLIVTGIAGRNHVVQGFTDLVIGGIRMI